MNFNSFDLICILKNCLTYIDYINLFHFLKEKQYIYFELEYPSFYFINVRKVKKIINFFIYESKNKILNSVFLENKIYIFYKKFIFQKNYLFNYSKKFNLIIFKKYILSLIKYLYKFIKQAHIIKKCEFCDQQLDFLFCVLYRYLPNNNF